jgi:glucose-6-phosphate 1-dehydrogenase
MIEKLVLFGATGDLAGRYLLPALAALRAAGELPDGFGVVGAAPRDLDDDGFRRHARERLDEHAADVPASARDALLRSLSYRRVDIGDPRSVRGALTAGDGEAPGPVAAYLALPTHVFPAAVSAIHGAGIPPGSRIALEKPFGEDLEGAVALNALLERTFGGAREEAVFRVDHVLGLATVQNLLGLRLANRILEPVWNGDHIEQVEILWEETLGLEGRAGYFDRAGALKDVLQNHMLQIFCLLAMELPADLARDLRDRKVDVLRAVRPLDPADAASRTRRARYAAGRLASPPEGSGERVPAYAEEPGVDPERRTETFAEVALELDSPRWAGTRFLLRAGKALRRNRKEIVVRFRPVPDLPFAHEGAPAANELRIGVDGPEELALTLIGSAGTPPRPVPLTLPTRPPAAELPAYGRVLLDLLRGGSALSVRSDEAEEAWRVVMPVLEAWAEGRVPLEEYPAGTDGPPPRAAPPATRAKVP